MLTTDQHCTLFSANLATYPRRHAVSTPFRNRSSCGGKASEEKNHLKDDDDFITVRGGARDDSSDYNKQTI
jgi:hypothetical protein